MPFTIPNLLNAATYPAQSDPDSVDFDALIAAHNQTGVLSGCAVTAQGSPDMTVAVAVGVVSSAGVSAAMSAGNVTITTADATKPRYDLIVASSSGVLSAVAGTPIANNNTTTAQPQEAVFPTIPAGSVILAAVTVPAAATTITTAQIVDKRIVLGSGLLPSTTRTQDFGSASLLWRALYASQEVIDASAAPSGNVPLKITANNAAASNIMELWYGGALQNFFSPDGGFGAFADSTASTSVRFGGIGPAGEACAKFGYDTNIYRKATSDLRCSGSLGLGERVNGQSVLFGKSSTELLTIAAAATTDTAMTIPANVLVLGVSVRVTTVIPTAATFTITGATSAKVFHTAAVSTAAGTTDKGNAAGAWYTTASEAVRITPNLTPGAATGVVRVTIHYIDIVPPTS